MYLCFQPRDLLLPNLKLLAVVKDARVLLLDLKQRLVLLLHAFYDCLLRLQLVLRRHHAVQWILLLTKECLQCSDLLPEGSGTCKG